MTTPTIEKAIIAVCGATGFQGGSVVKHLLRDGSFAIRGLTRKPNSAGAKELASLGVEIVQADFDDPPSLLKAFKGCYGVYGVTDYFEAYEKEAQQGFNIIDAARAEGIKHIVFSTGEKTLDETPILKYKAEIASYLREAGVPFTDFRTAFYYGNTFLLEALRRDPKTGGWQYDFPFPTDVPIPSVSPKDIGAYVLVIFKDPSQWIGETVKVINEYISPREYAETFAEVTGSPVKIREVTEEEFLALRDEPFILQSWGVFKWFYDQYKEGRPDFDIGFARRLCPNPQTWRDYVAEHETAPPEQPAMLIQCYQTREQFTENPVIK